MYAHDLLSNRFFVLKLIGQFFDFHSTKLEHVLILPSNAVSIMLQRDNGLLASICDDNVIRVVDVETRAVVREFSGFRGRVLDLASPSYCN